MTRDDLVAYLGEGMHTAFRKGSDHPSADVIWKLIRDMPDREWRSIVAFVADGMLPTLDDQLDSLRAMQKAKKKAGL